MFFSKKRYLKEAYDISDKVLGIAVDLLVKRRVHCTEEERKGVETAIDDINLLRVNIGESMKKEGITNV